MAQNPAQRGPSSATQSKEAQLKVYQKRLRDDIKAMTDNFLEIIRLMKVLFGFLLWSSLANLVSRFSELFLNFSSPLFQDFILAMFFFFFPPTD